MVFHKSDPANFDGPGGEEFHLGSYVAGRIKADLAELAIGCCFEHGAKIIDRLMADYVITPKRQGKYL